jgi:SAM-dependent methyltransferase
MSDVETQEKTHADYVDRIGGTHHTGRTTVEQHWNAYYRRVYERTVSDLLRGETRGTVLDCGTSDGRWYDFLRAEGFARVIGVELDPGRAAAARSRGYDDVHTGDAAELPYDDASVDVAVSNDVFVHILRAEDKLRVLREVERVLKPGGCFVFNQASAVALGGPSEYTVIEHCSFMTLDEVIRLVHDGTGLKVRDVRPSYFHWRTAAPPRALTALRRFVGAPVVPRLLAELDLRWTRSRLSIDDSDAFYLKLRKA